jgi:hypothetical protein
MNIPLSSCSKIIYNNIDLTKVIYNGVTVWELKPEEPSLDLQDFYYTYNSTDDTYTLTNWKKTYQGVRSRKCVIPDDPRIIL